MEKKRGNLLFTLIHSEFCLENQHIKFRPITFIPGDHATFVKFIINSSSHVNSGCSRNRINFACLNFFPGVNLYISTKLVRDSVAKSMV